MSLFSMRNLALALNIFLMQSGSAVAQIVEDGSLPESTRITDRGQTIEITGGTRRGDNLFHSFDRFSVPEGQAAFFNNDLAIENIFGRVTGSERSRIDGLIQANGSANLFLLNPNGIIFGENARLDIGGSFVGSSATSLRFADGTEFSAVNPQASPLLTVSVPIGLQFGRSNPGQIRVQGTGNGLFLNSPDDPSVNRRDRPVGLEVNSGETLALVGGGLSLQGGNLTAAGGRIELGSVDRGQVALTPTASGWRLGYDGIDRFGDIRLSQAASLEVSGDRAGENSGAGTIDRDHRIFSTAG
ncbi:MAG: filamentous hemagglutinin N-terminal domain-containing protein [Leptolyngbyaceae cyanobacterium SM1_3_5]|nr:filamentous hemagglutinin N-terminal domain-containing protein [Leptolyngbyaceae cyanobacterium SM1_3_5]